MSIYTLKSLCFCAILFTSCNGQTKNKPAATLVGGGCDGCDVMYVGMPANILSSDTCVDWKEGSRKLVISGTILKSDGKTPAPGVILYYYHTDSTGYYTRKSERPESNTRHGYIRGWVKSDNSGHYSIYTTMPAPYPAHS